MKLHQSNHCCIRHKQIFPPVDAWRESYLKRRGIDCIARHINDTVRLHNTTLTHCICCQRIAHAQCKWKPVTDLQTDNTQLQQTISADNSSQSPVIFYHREITTVQVQSSQSPNHPTNRVYLMSQNLQDTISGVS